MAEASIEKTQILQKYLELDQRGRIIAEYVWIDGTGNLRSKGGTSTVLLPTKRQATTLTSI